MEPNALELEKYLLIFFLVDIYLKHSKLAFQIKLSSRGRGLAGKR